MTRAKVAAGQRTFVSPAHKNEKFLVQAGKIVQAAPNSFSGGLPIDLRRDGDVWAEFHDGILLTEDPVVIAWCEANDGSPIPAITEDDEVTYEPDICKDAEDPQARAWVALKENTLETSTKTASLPRDMDVGKVLRGEVEAISTGNSLVDRALATAGR